MMRTIALIPQTVRLVSHYGRVSTTPPTASLSNIVVCLQKRSFFTSPYIAGSQHFLRHFSTTGGGGDAVTTDSSNSKTGETRHPQDFVSIEIEPGEWDRKHTDPLFRPRWRTDSKMKIMSAEDFDNQPAVSFSEDYDSLYDAMILLSWMDHKTHDKIYMRYCQLMVAMSERTPGKLSSTSHEYVMRILAQEFHITSDRAAALVQLRHNEEQIRKANPDLVHDDVAEYIDATVMENITNAYASVNEVHPEEFVEQPALMGGTGEMSKTVMLPDLYDQKELWDQMLVREDEDARLMINNHIYIEDVDESKIPVKLTAEYQKLIKHKEQLALEQQQLEEKAKVDHSAIPKPLPESGRVPTRERSKFVAIMLNTREIKKIPAYQRRRQRVEKERREYQNILFEQDGELRSVTLAEVKMTSLKPVRTRKENTFGGVKKAWLERVTKQAKGVWGPQEAPTKILSDEE